MVNNNASIRNVIRERLGINSVKDLILKPATVDTPAVKFN